MMHKAWCSAEEVPYCFFDDLNPISSKITRLVAAIKSLRFALFSLKLVFKSQACSDNKQLFLAATKQL